MEPEYDLAAALNDNTQKLLAWADTLQAKQLAQQPAPGKWTVLEVLEHIFIVDKGAARLSKPDAEPTERDLDESRNRMMRGMADLNQPFAGGSAIDPKGRFADYAEWRAAFVANRAELLQLGNEKGWNGLCAMFPHPFFGHLNRAEWVIMVVLHTERHLAQMQAFVA